jgi:lysophospholipase L1-like esterase
MRTLVPLAALVCLAAAVVVLVVRNSDGAVTGSVTMLGDSLNVGIEPYVEDELAGWKISNENAVGRRTDEGVALLRALGAKLAPVVVVSLGTNDPQTDVEQFRAHIEQVLRIAGPKRCVVWSTIWLDGPSDGFNTVLRQAAERHGSLEINDWAALVQSRPELLAPDRVHGSPEGYARRAQEIARIVRRCLPPPEPAS